MRLEEYIRQRGKELTEVKRGRGGIRDVEFAVQLLQIVHGRRDARLRDPNTLRALATLAEEGYVARADADALADAYRFLRRLEHRLQIVRDLQTHDLPSDPRARRTIARVAGAGGRRRGCSSNTTAPPRRSAGSTSGCSTGRCWRRSRAPPRLTPGVDRAATQELLAGLGFGSPARSYEVLRRLVDPATRMGKVLAHVFAVMAPALALAVDPDAALVRLERVAEAVGTQDRLADALANDPGAARRLAQAVAVSSFATDLLVAVPARLLALPDAGECHRPQAALVATVARSAGRELSLRETGVALSDVADRVVRDAMAGEDPGLPFAVIGLGKLGAGELNVASDLDLVFVYEGEGPADLKRAGSVAEHVMQGIRAQGWEPDADLRPEGRGGPLARSIAGFLEYWQRYAELWEFQSLLRARFVAGDPDLGRRFELNAADVAYPPEGLTIDRVDGIRAMRRRIERERVKPADAAKFHFKLGVGSLADVQFAVELSLMRHGGAHPQLRTRSTLEAIDRLAQERFLPGSAAHDLGEAFVFCSDVKNALEVDRRLHAEALPSDPAAQTALARRLGYEEYPRQAFLDDYLRVTRRCRRAMERVFQQGP